MHIKQCGLCPETTRQLNPNNTIHLEQALVQSSLLTGLQCIRQKQSGVGDPVQIISLVWPYLISRASTVHPTPSVV